MEKGQQERTVTTATRHLLEEMLPGTPRVPTITAVRNQLADGPQVAPMVWVRSTYPFGRPMWRI